MFNSQNERNLLFNRSVLSVLLVLILGILLSIFMSVEAQLSLFGEDKEKIGPGVLETLQTEGEAKVVVALIESQAMKLHRNDLTHLRREVAIVQNDVLSSLDVADFRVEHKYQAIPALSGRLLTEDGLFELAQNANVVKIDLDVGGRGGLDVSVPLIGANTWHDAGIIGNGVVVAVLDSGLDTDHSDLAAALIHQECFLDDDGSINGSGLCPNGSDRQSGAGAAEDDAGHGTHVTGIISSRGNQSSVGVAPGTEIVSIKVTAGPSFSGVFFYFSEIVAALDFIISDRPDVQIINMSLVTNATFAGNCDNSTSWTMAGASAINTLRANGVTAFASSGNTGSGTLMAAPACLSNVISVGATDDVDNVASFTSSNTTTDVMAPGVSILSSGLANGTITASGTSMASPHAAGCAALLIASGEAITPDQIEMRLETSPVQVTDITNGLTFPRIECSLKPLTDVVISGSTTGAVNVAYGFTATTSPITATQPITYLWRASGQSPVTNTNGLSDTMTFAWPVSGTQFITVTAQNHAGVVTDTHIITIGSHLAPTSVAISGSLMGITGITYTLTAATSPLTVTQPITYLWQASGQSPVTNISGLSDTVAFAWSVPGTQLITVTAHNRVGLVTDTHTITISRPSPTSVAISGPLMGTAGITYTFTAATSPLTVTQPITYLWQASGQSPVTNTSGLSDTVAFAWPLSGTQLVTVTADNGVGLVTDTHTITISRPSPTSVAISGALTGTIGITYTFMATINPLTVTQPITYLWQASGQSPVTNTGGLSDTVAFQWHTPGIQVITVTARSSTGVMTDTHVIVINQRIYLPIVLKQPLF